MNHDYALDGTDQQEAREARRDPAYWEAVEDEHDALEVWVQIAAPTAASANAEYDAFYRDLMDRADRGEFDG